MLPAPLEESGTTTRLLRMRDRLGVGLIVALCSAGLAACGGGERQDANEPEADFPVQITSAEFPAKQKLAQHENLTLSVQNAGDETIPNLAVTIFTVADEEDNSTADASAADPESNDSSTTSGDELADDVEQQLQEELQAAEDDENQSDEEKATDTDATTNADGEPIMAGGPFSVLSKQPGLAIPSRPVWILEQGFPRLAGTEPGPPPPGELSGTGGATTASTNTYAFGELEPGETADLVWELTPVQRGTYTVSYRLAAGLEGKAVAVNDDGSVPEGQFVVQISDAPPQTRVTADGKVVPIKPGDIIGQAGSSAQQDEIP